MHDLDYDSQYVQAALLADIVRVDAYREAIARVVQPGMNIVDLGAGTGIMGRLAAEQGAAKVTMIEQHPRMCQLCKYVNSFLATGDAKLEVLCATAEEARVEGPIDCVISEIIG